MESRSPCLVELPWIKLHNFCSERVWAAARVAEFPCLSAINVSSLGRKWARGRLRYSRRQPVSTEALDAFTTSARRNGGSQEK